MFDRSSRNFMRSRPGFRDLAALSGVIGRWLPFAGRRSAVGTVLQHLGTLPLTTQSSLALVRVYEETLVLGITPQSVTLLTKAAAHDSNSVPACEDSIASGEPNPGSFPTAAVSPKGE